MNKKKFEDGYKKRKKVLGTKYVNQAMKDKNLFNEDFQDFITINCWDKVWNRKYLNDKQKLLNIHPHIPLNSFLDAGDISLSSSLISAFSGGAGGGTGHQNYGLKFHYGLSDASLFSIYLSETDDPLYNLIGGELIPNNWASIALAYKRQIYESGDFRNLLSF